MEQNEKPYQFLAWTATAILILAAILASFVPAGTKLARIAARIKIAVAVHAKN